MMQAMSSAGTASRFKHVIVRQAFFCLAVFAFLCRALIPPGYMPAQSAHGDAPTMTICTAQGSIQVQSMLMDLAGHDGHAPTKHSSHHSCPFGVAFSQVALPALPALAVVAPITKSLTVLAGVRSHVPVLGFTLGPPLGPRAPPSRFA